MKRLSLLAFLLLVGGWSAWAQNASPPFISTSLTAQGAAPPCVATQCVGLAVGNSGGATFTLGGTWMGTVSFYSSGDAGKTAVPLTVYPSNSTSGVTTATGNGTWARNVSAYTNVYAVFTTATSGTVVATINLSPAASSAGNGGGGGGTGCVPSGSAGDMLTDSGSGSCNSSADFVLTSHTLAGGSSAILNLSAASATAGLEVPTAAGAIPTADGAVAVNSTNHTLVNGSNGTTIVEAAAATGTGTGTTCTNQVITAISGIVAPTCSNVSNAMLSSAATTVNGQTCTLGSTCTVPFQTNTTNNMSQAGINLLTSTVNTVGLTVTPTNPGTNTETFEVTGGSYTGSAAKWTTARNLAGNSVDGSANVAFSNKFIVQGTTDAGLSGAQFLGALGTGFVYNTTTTGLLSIATAANGATLIQGLTGCNTATYVFTPQGSDCVAPSGGSGISGLTSGYIPIAGSATTITGNSHVDDGVTTAAVITSSEPIAVTSDGVHPSMVSLVGNTTLPTLATNTVNILGPPSASPTSWSFQLATAIPTTGHLLDCTVTSTNCLMHDSGVVTANVVTSSASLANGGVVLGTAGTQASGTNTQLTFSAPTLTVGLAGTSTGILALTGVTSGSATLTAPAVAGTTTNAVTSSNVLTGPAFISNGTTAGFVDYAQGSTSASVAPCNAATSRCVQAAAAMTSSVETLAGTTAQGIFAVTGSSSAIQDAYSGDSNHSATVTTGSGTSVGSTTLCSSTNCPAGTYMVNVYIDVTTACGTSGTYIVNLIYTDDQGSKTIPVNINGSGTVPATGTLTTTSTANYGENSQVLRLTSGNLNYSTTATACGTAGPMVGKLYLSAVPVM